MSQINLRVDENIKKSAEQACVEMGISLTTAINIYLIKLGREKRIPFEISADPFYSSENINRLKSVFEIKNHDSFTESSADIR